MKIWITLFLCWTSWTAAAAETVVPLWQQMQKAALVSPDVAEVRRILEAGFDPNGSIGCGDWPALMAAVQHRNVEMAAVLLERGAKVPDEAMLRACQTYDQELTLVTLLRSHGGNGNAGNDATSCLHAAAWYGNVPLVKWLAASPGIDLNRVRQDGDLDGTPLMWALRRGNTRVAQVLIAAGANPAIKGRTGATAVSIVAEQLKVYAELQASLKAPAASSNR